MTTEKVEGYWRWLLADVDLTCNQFLSSSSISKRIICCLLPQHLTIAFDENMMWNSWRPWSSKLNSNKLQQITISFYSQEVLSNNDCMHSLESFLLKKIMIFTWRNLSTLVILSIMPPKSNARKKEGSKRDSDASNSNDSRSAKPTKNKHKQSHRRSISTSTTNEPSSASTSIAEARHPRALPDATAATAAAPTAPLSEKKSRRAGFREQFLQKVRQTSTCSKHVLGSVQL